MKYNILRKLIYILAITMIVSCETTNLDLLENPSSLGPSSVDPTLLLNNIQLKFQRGIASRTSNQTGINVRAQEIVRMEQLFGPYTGPFSLTSSGLDDSWRSFYRETLQDIKVLIPIAEDRNLKGHIGIAKILQAYSFVTLVDTYGDVPYSEALQGADFPNPKTDSGQLVYNDMLVVLDEAIAALNTPNVLMPNTDLYYNGDSSKWIKIANTLKFKMYAQMRLIGDYKSEINTLISSGTLINTIEEDFQFNYSSDDNGDDSRSTYFATNYDANGANDYMSSFYVNLLKQEKGFEDPRLRYYFYRQTNTNPTGDDLPCQGNPTFNYCYLGEFYWTRDHGDDSGVPPDNLKRTIYGLYPVGGAFDNDSFQAGQDNKGAGGAGIFPFMLSSYVKFLLAESALTIGTTGDPKTLLEQGIRESMNKVLNFSLENVDASFASNATDVNNYVTFVLDQYDAATDDDARLNIIMTEYYIALWGNGIEAWNNYRRTSMPNNLSPHVSTAGVFTRTFMYPAIVVNSNSNINQKVTSDKVFWDTNPDNLQ